MCSSLRTRDVFGVDADDEYIGVPLRRISRSLMYVVGKGGIKWEHQPVSLKLAHALRARLVEALGELDAEIAAATGSRPDADLEA